MKRIVIFVLAVLICFLLVACKGNESKIDTPKDSAAEHIEETEEATEEITPEVEDESSGSYSPLLYKVSDADSCIWLFGSIHLGNEEMQELPEYVTEAFDASDALAVECNINAIEDNVEGYLQALSTLLYTDGTTIAEHIPEDLYNRAKSILEEGGMYYPMLDYYKPSYWSTCISQLAVADTDYSLELAIDTLFMDMAEADGKEIKEIESVTFQYMMMSSFSEELQIALIEGAVEQYGTDEATNSLTAMVDAWCRGDAEALLSEASSEAELSSEDELILEEYNREMVTERNITMTDYAEQALKANSQLFICVGSAHVMGEDAMADLLGERGYTVEIIG